MKKLIFNFPNRNKYVERVLCRVFKALSLNCPKPENGVCQ